VSDGCVVDVTGREVELASTIEQTHANKVEIIFSSSAKLSLKISSIQLRLIASLGKFEDWSGPLRNIQITPPDK
jgi:hypothetical protein